MFVDKQAALARASEAITHYDVRCEGPEQQVRLLSGGNMQKLILARALSPKPSFILANQPVRGLDEGRHGRDVCLLLLLFLIHLVNGWHAWFDNN